ncbi:dual specificity calcium/calmodulin-dependent 3',5'-cyclic nucleotide phosphodiesterase 1-like isoform X2 [Metopolophium dirhodum]|uniref:dual specificity calcium/calmodulin-dependent 3',5'-cyclic nucleotide phosphodiesterase 1-like isoform X2 n=1 Tax=Metopolophium dirhodum TaxID=44670 RepID=UPI00298F4F59|nr:dual specificity calcium/calmodulin-dependent 3',5'-cyclic nucleotide phosphodiesterase 1-like isoform X2 [Metopolophium dirhodum]
MDRMEEEPAGGVDLAQTSDEKCKTSAVGDRSETKQTVGGGEHPTTTDRTNAHDPEVDVVSGDRGRLVGNRTGEQRTTGVSWSGEERIADESPIEWENGVECARDWRIVDDRAEAAAQITDEEMLPLLLINDEPRVRDQMVQVPISRLPSNTKRCVLTMDGYSYVIVELPSYGVAGPPDTEDPFEGNRDDPVFMDTNEGASSSQDSDQSSRQGALTIVRRSSQKKSTYSEEYSMALSRENESMLDDVDLSLEAMPSFDSSEAVDKAALRLRCLLRHLRKGEISAEVLHKNLFFAAKVLESAFLDEEQICDMKNSQEELEEISKAPEPSTSSAAAITSPVVRQKRLRAPIWARRLAAEEDDELSEVQPDAVPQEVRDWLASTFTRQMACTRRKGEEKPKFKSVAHAIRAGIFVDRMYRRVINAPMMTFPPDVIEVLKDINDWSFDVYKLNNYGNGQPLKYLGYDLLNRYGIFQKFKVPSVVMENFLCRIEEGYSRHKNPYHNNLHGADVAQTVHYMLCQTGLMNWLSDLEIFAMLIAAITHDFEHTGTTNNFHVMSGTEIALLYNDRAVLENYHISSTFRILKDEDCNILQNLTKEEFREFRTLVIDMVLATDMSFHFQQLKTMKQLLASPEPTIDKSKAMSMVLHCADISHPAKEWDLHYRWTSQLLEEFFLQGDMEKKLGLPFSPLCDRNNTLIAESQIGFIEFIVEPSMTVCSDMLELILGPINLVNASKTVDTNLVVDENDEKTDNSNQSDVAIACTAMSCSIEDSKDMKENKDMKGSKDVMDTKETQHIESSKDSPSTSKDTKHEEKSDKESKQETNAEDPKSSNKLYKIKKPWNDCLVINKKKWKVQAAREAKLRESKTKYTMRDIRMPLPGELVQDEDKSSSTDVEIVE